MTRIDGRVQRSISLDLYADITDAPLVAWGRDFLEFDGDLTEEQQAAIWARMESRDDADQAARAALRADRDALDPDDPLRRTINYVLGDAE